MSIFKKKYDVLYRFYNKKDEIYYDSIRRNEKRVPNIGEKIHFICRGNRECKIFDVKTHLTHDPNKCVYVVDVI